LLPWGKKHIWLDREVFEDYGGSFTDGRTGFGLGDSLEKLQERIPDIVERILQEESKIELSPRYNSEYTYPMVNDRRLRHLFGESEDTNEPTETITTSQH
jgi:hypothetical protein